MSLHVGQIPPHVQPEELQRVFRRFGRCSLDMKDGYGFAVFDVSSDAEAALRALRGKHICGEQLSLNWSNKQPRPFQRPARPSKIYKPIQRRNFRVEDHGMRIRDSKDRKDFSKSNSRLPAYSNGKYPDDMVDKGADCIPESIEDIGEERGVALKERVEDVGNSSEPNAVTIDRWGESVNGGVTGNEMYNDTEFDRYEPYHGYDRKEKEDNKMGNSYDSSHDENPQVKGRREHLADEAKSIDHLKPQPTCYNCGLSGHIKRYCPERDAKREKLTKFSHSRDEINFPERDAKQEKLSKFSDRRDEINFRGRNDGMLKIPRTNSWRRPDASRYSLVPRREGRDRKESQFGKSRRFIKSENFSEKEKRRPKLRAESQWKKLSEQRHGNGKKVTERSSRRFNSRSGSSGSSTSSSQTQSGTSKSKSQTSSHSTSRSLSSRSRSASSNLRPASVSPYHKSKSSRSRSRSRSRSSSYRSASLSVSWDKKSPSSSRNVNLNVSEDRSSPRGNLVHPICPSSKHHVDENMKNFKAEDGNVSLTCKVNNQIDLEHSGDNINEACYSASTFLIKENNSGTDKDVAVVSENCREENSLQETPPIKSNEQIAVGCDRRNSSGITIEEMILALKHYGLPAPEKGESGISVEGYFGAARLWPWEMMHYRRLKKGPISTENYAWRLLQNKEFGIVDRYIRSSSGWGQHE